MAARDARYGVADRAEPEKMSPICEPAGASPKTYERNRRAALAHHCRLHREPKEAVAKESAPHREDQEYWTRKDEERYVEPEIPHACHALRSSLYFFSKRSIVLNSSFMSSHSRSRSSMKRWYSGRERRPPKSVSRRASILRRNSSLSGKSIGRVRNFTASGDRVLSHRYPVRSGRFAMPSKASERSSSGEQTVRSRNGCGSGRNRLPVTGSAARRNWASRGVPRSVSDQRIFVCSC